jgi:fibronectin-binding autotransporter adhesin
MSITIGANGVVEGGVAAIRAAASSQDIAIANFGTVRNVSQASSALAVDAVATGRLTLRNTGLVLGTVRLDGAATSLTNLTGAIWNTAGGTNQMGANAAANRVENQAGATVIAAAAGAGGPVTTTFNGLGEFANAGLVQLQNRVAGDRLMINGSYSGAGGTISLDTYLGGDASATDLVRITGNTSGSSLLRVANVGGPGAPTVEGIKVVDVGGASNGVFTLLGDYNLSGQPAVIGGAYAYTLQKNGISASSDGDWYLRSTLTVSPQPPQPPQPQEPQPQQPGEPQPQQPQQPGIPQPQAPSPQPLPIWQPGAPLYETMPRVALDFMQMLTLQQRVGNRFWPGRAETAPGGAGSGATAEGNGIWGRIDGSFSRSDPGRSTTDAHASQRMWRGEIGADFLGWSGAAGILTGGLTVHYGQVLADINSPWGRGSNRTTGYGLGATATWYGTGGFYADAQGRLSWLSTDLNSETLARRMGKDVEGLGHALSLELGQRFGASHDFQLIPQAQLSWTGVRYDRFVDPYGAFVSAGDGQSLQGRLGLAVQREQQWTDASGRARRASVYGIANLYHEFLDGLSVKVSGARLANREARTWAGVGVGGTYNLNGDALSLYGEIQAAANVSGSGDSYRLSGKAGLRVRW